MHLGTSALAGSLRSLTLTALLLHCGFRIQIFIRFAFQEHPLQGILLLLCLSDRGLGCGPLPGRTLLRTGLGRTLPGACALRCGRSAVCNGLTGLTYRLAAGLLRCLGGSCRSLGRCLSGRRRLSGLLR